MKKRFRFLDKDERIILWAMIFIFGIGIINLFIWVFVLMMNFILNL